MHILLLVIKLIPSILALVQLAEQAFTNKPQSGAEKKDYVMRAVEALIAGASTVFTGGAADTFARITPFISPLIDSAASIAFPHEPGKIDSMGGGN